MNEIIDRLLATLHRKSEAEPPDFDQAVEVMGRNHVARHKVLTALGGSKTYAPEIAVLGKDRPNPSAWRKHLLERAERLLSNDDTDLVNAAQVSALASRANDGLERLHEAAVAAERSFRSQVGA